MDSEQRKRFSKLLNNQADIQPGDETELANNPRNWLADKVNPLLEEYVNPVLPEAVQMAIPKMTVADEKTYQANLPEQMAGSAMGTIGKAASMTRPGANVFGPKPTGVGSVKVIDSAADKLAAAQKAALQKGSEKVGKVAEQNRVRFQQLFGEELARKKAMAQQMVDEAGGNPEAIAKAQEMLGSFISENMGKVRRGEF